LPFIGKSLDFIFHFLQKQQINASLEQYFYCNSFLVRLM